MNTRNETQNQNGQNAAKDIPLKIISIPDKEWKEYRNQAPQDQLLVLSLGMKLWLSRTRKSTLFFTLALLLSVAIGIVVTIFAQPIAGVIILAAGYLIFCTLCLRRHFIGQSCDQAVRKLTAENKKMLNEQIKKPAAATFADVVMTLILCTVCQPYFLALAVLSAVIPSLLNTKLVIPEGYGFEQLEEIKSYYAEQSFFSEAVGMWVDYDKKYTRGTQQDNADDDDAREEYSFTDQNGYTQTVYADRNGKDAYDAGGRYVGELSGEGEEKKFTPADQPTKRNE